MGDVHWSLGFIVPESLEVEAAMVAQGDGRGGLTVTKWGGAALWLYHCGTLCECMSIKISILRPPNSLGSPR